MLWYFNNCSAHCRNNSKICYPFCCIRYCAPKDCYEKQKKEISGKVKTDITDNTCLDKTEIKQQNISSRPQDIEQTNEICCPDCCDD